MYQWDKVPVLRHKPKFGGRPTVKFNITWILLQQHVNGVLIRVPHLNLSPFILCKWQLWNLTAVPMIVPIINYGALYKRTTRYHCENRKKGKVTLKPIPNFAEFLVVKVCHRFEKFEETRSIIDSKSHARLPGSYWNTITCNIRE